MLAVRPSRQFAWFDARSLATLSPLLAFFSFPDALTSHGCRTDRPSRWAFAPKKASGGLPRATNPFRESYPVEPETLQLSLYRRRCPPLRGSFRVYVSRRRLLTDAKLRIRPPSFLLVLQSAALGRLLCASSPRIRPGAFPASLAPFSCLVCGRASVSNAYLRGIPLGAFFIWRFHYPL
ncbi:hypothetical protein C8R46DRAFT_441737 [Mycena filopes]|nr:hypothetical protein C8R46DRAFT_441737 [Mycena filopes]